MKVRMWREEKGCAPINSPIRYEALLSFSHLEYRWGATLEEHEKSLTDEEILKVAVPLAELSL